MTHAIDQVSTATKTSVKPLYEYPTQLMSPQLTEVLLNLMLSTDEQVLKAPGLTDAFQYRIAKSRLQTLGVDASESTIVFLSFLTGTPGDNSLYCHAIKAWAVKIGLTGKFTLKEFCDMFPMGFPDLSTMTKAWDEQKIGGANGVDLALSRPEMFE